MQNPLYQIFGNRGVADEAGYSICKWPSHWAEKEPITEKDILLRLALHLSYGNYSNITDMFGVTQNLCTAEYMPLFDTCQPLPHTSRTWCNIDSRYLTLESLERALRVIPYADTLITGDDAETVQRAKELLLHINSYRIEEQFIQLFVIPELLLDPMGRPNTSKRHMWFLADLKRSTAHFRRCDDGRIEVGVLSPFWIYGAFAQ